MKIVLLTSHLSPASGGLSQSVLSLASALERTGDASPRIIAVRDKRALEGWRSSGADVRLCTALGPRGFGCAPFLLREIRQFQPDIIDVQGLWMYPSLVSSRWNRRTSQPYVVTAHGMLDPWALQRSVWKKRIARWCYEDRHLHRAACLRATSAMEAGHFRAFGLKNPIAIVPNGIDLPPVQQIPENAGRPNRILFLSRIHPKKGIDFLLRAWSHLHRLHLTWELVIAGPDEVGHRADMQKLVEELGLERVYWREAVYNKEKSDLYASADLFVLPTHAENFGLVVGEALAHRVPAITTRNAPWQGLEEHRCGWWIELSDEALTNAISEGMSLSTVERRKMGARGSAWVEAVFAWPTIGQQMAELYQWVVGTSARPSFVIGD